MPPLRLRFDRRVAALALVVAYAVTRLVNLGSLPMVSDEGTYITWGVRALHASAPQDWLASLEDGKQPLLAWLMPPFLAAIEDRLIAGRLVSAATGFANLGLVAALTKRLFGARAAVLAGLLYVAVPIALIHDRMALYDSLVTTAALASFLAAIAWAERPDQRRTLVLGLAMSAAVLTKLSAAFFVALVPIVAGFHRPRSLRRWWLLAQAFFLAGAAYSVLYLSPIVDNLAEGNFQRYSLTPGEILRFPLDLWLSNAAFIGAASLTYLGLPLAVASALGMAWLVARPTPDRIALALWVVVPLLAFAITAKVIYTRYLVFSFVCALPAVAALVSRARAPLLLTASLVVLLAPAARFDALLLGDPASAPWFDDRRWITDRFQYVESNYAGYGLRQIVDTLLARSRERPIVVISRSATGMPRDGVTAYLLHRPRIDVDLIPESDPVRRRLAEQPTRAFHDANQGDPVYYVLTDAPGGEQELRFRSLNPEAQLELTIPKPGNHSRFLLSRIPWVAVGEDRVLSPPAVFENGISLAGYNVSSRDAHPGDTVRLTLYWQAAAAPERDLTVFNHVAGPGDVLAGQQDSQPAGGLAPTSGWRPGQFIADSHVIVIRPDAAPGTYELRTGLYELRTLQRVPVTLPGGATTHFVPLGALAVSAS